MQFVDRTRNHFGENLREQMLQTLGDRFVDEVAANVLSEDGGCTGGGCALEDSVCG